jgi:hypothetical protein
MAVTFKLDSGTEAHAEFPDTFALQSANDRSSLGRGDLAKLMFRISDGEKESVERMWVRVQAIRPEGYIGTLDNDAYCTPEIRSGMRVEFTPDHVIQIQRDAS